MLDERVHAAETHGRGDQPDPGDDPVGVAEHLERHHGAADLRVVHPRDPGSAESLRASSAADEDAALMRTGRVDSPRSSR